MNKTVFRPLLSDRIYMLIWIGVGCLLMITAYHASWVLDYSGQSTSDHVLEEKFDPSAVDLGLFLFGLTLLILAIEVMGRSVEINAGSLRSFSPLRLASISSVLANCEC